MYIHTIIIGGFWVREEGRTQFNNVILYYKIKTINFFYIFLYDFLKIQF